MYGLAGSSSSRLRPQRSLSTKRPDSSSWHSVKGRQAARPLRRVSAQPDEFDDVGGDKKLQDALVEVLRVEMKRQEVKDELETSYQEGVQQLRSIAEEAKEELEKLSELNKMRANLSLDSTLADLMQEADEFEAQLRKSREALEADKREFDNWEQKIRADQNEGLFFKGLYKPEKRDDEEGSSGASGASSSSGGSSSSSSSSIVDKEKLAATAAAVKLPAQEEARSPLRLYLCLYMIAVLGFAVVQDVLSTSPSYAIDGLYTAIGVGLGVNAYGERQLLLGSEDDAAAGPGGSSSSSSLGNSSSSGGGGESNRGSQGSRGSRDEGLQ